MRYPRVLPDEERRTTRAKPRGARRKTRATGGGYSEAPSLEFDGGLIDYLVMYEGLTADDPSLKPRAGTIDTTGTSSSDSSLSLILAA